MALMPGGDLVLSEECLCKAYRTMNGSGCGILRNSQGKLEPFQESERDSEHYVEVVKRMKPVDHRGDVGEVDSTFGPGSPVQTEE